MATKLTREEAGDTSLANPKGNLGRGSANFIELDAEKMGVYWPVQPNFDCVWISEALSHFPDKQLFFQNASKVLRPNGKLVIADWFKAEDLTDAQLDADIKPIEG